MTARHRMPTRLTAVVIRRGKVLLARRTHDQQWELPGGDPRPRDHGGEAGIPADGDAGDLADGDVAAALSRLVRSSTGQAVLVGPEVYDTEVDVGGAPVQLIAFGCRLEGRLPLQISEQYRQVAWLPVDELPLPHLAPGSADAIAAWATHAHREGSDATG